MQPVSATSESSEDVLNAINPVLDLMVKSEYLDKSDFLEQVFNAAFSLIREADKGTIFEIHGIDMIPVAARGYDLDQIKLLGLQINSALNHYEHILSREVDAYIKKVHYGRNLNDSDEKKGILEKLGTHREFHMLYAPIIVNHGAIGIIHLDNFRDGFDKTSPIKLRLFAVLISQFYTRIFQQKETMDKYLEIVQSLVSAIELKDQYTKGHALRVRDYSVALANELEMPLKMRDNIMIASLLHDVGKIGIPSILLNKTEKLDKEEWLLIQKHPEFSKKIIDSITDFEHISRIACTHHERYDGRGYPGRLGFNDVPVESHIIQIADAFDAMTSDRAYRDAMPVEKALAIIEEESGHQFHPEFAESFIKMIRNKRE